MAKMLIPEEEYYRLTPMGRELHDYWMGYKQKMYKELAANGTLLEILQKEGWRINEIVVELMQNGIDQAGAMEVARAEIYDEMMS